MNHSRRAALKTGSGAGVLAFLLAAGIVRPGELLAQSVGQGAFAMKTVPDAMRALGAQNPAARASHVWHRHKHGWQNRQYRR